MDRQDEDRASGPVGQRRPVSLYRQGTEPDPRFSMANERTALAWVRTSLAMVAGGVGLTSVARLAGLSPLVAPGGRPSCACSEAGLRSRPSSAGAAGNWRCGPTDHLPAPVALPWLAGAIVLASLGLAVLVLTVRTS